MRLAYFLAFLILGLCFLTHTFLGTTEILTPLRAGRLSPFLTAFGSVLWHLVTVALLGFTALQYRLWQHPDHALAAIMAMVYAGFAMVFIYYGLSDLGTLWAMPQWVAFVLAMACLIPPACYGKTAKP